MIYSKEIATYNDYVDLMNKNKHIIDEISKICIKTGEPVEGNCISVDKFIDIKPNEFIFKQINLYSLGKVSNNILEIGFNAGHSSLLFLLSNKTSKITAFDLCEHKYTQLCFEYLNSLFPNRINLIKGDSTIKVPEYYQNNKDEKFDLIHIDGCHEEAIANKDFNNTYKMASKYIIWDDTQLNELNKLFDSYISSGLVYEVKLYRTLIYKHRVAHINNLLNKTFSWNNSSIKFLNFKMNAFGAGLYNYIDEFLVKADFGNEEHILRFNNNFTNFTSIRIRDNFYVNGKLLNS